MRTNLHTVTIYSDGSSNNKSKSRYGGFGVLLMCQGLKKEIVEGFQGVTNNQMELLGVIRGLEEVVPGYRIIIKSDSKYAVDGGTKWVWEWEQYGLLGFKKNKDLWERFIKCYKRHPRGFVTLKHVKGHVGEEFNERADELAKMGYKEQNERTVAQYLKERDLIMKSKDKSWNIQI